MLPFAGVQDTPQKPLREQVDDGVPVHAVLTEEQANSHTLDAPPSALHVVLFESTQLFGDAVQVGTQVAL